VKQHDNLAVAARLSVGLTRWREQFDDLMGRIAGPVRPGGPRRRAQAFVLGLLSGLRRKNCWTIAEQAGDATPDGSSSRVRLDGPPGGDAVLSRQLTQHGQCAIGPPMTTGIGSR